MKNKDNPHVPKKGMQQRTKHQGGAYYTARANIRVSPGIKDGLIAIAEDEERSLSWVVNEVFRMFFGLRDDTEYLGLGKKRKRK